MWGPRGASIAYVFGANIYYRSLSWFSLVDQQRLFFPQGDSRISRRDGDSDRKARRRFQRCGRLGLRRRGGKNYFGTNLRERVQVLSDTRAIWFSPDGDKIAWTQFNDTDVSIRNVVMLIILEIIDDNENYIPNFNIWIFFVVWDDMLKCNEIDILTNYSNCLNMT